MILFHASRVDSGDLRLWRRVLLPAYQLRRAGVPVRIVAGELVAREFAGARVMLTAGAVTDATARHCRLARDAGLQVVLDIGDNRALDGNLAALRAAAAAAHSLTVANAALSAAVAQRLAPVRPLIETLPDPGAEDASLLHVLAAFPGIGVRLLADAIKIRAIDLVRRVRRRILDGPTARQRRPLVIWFGDAAGLNEEGGLGELLLAAGALVDLAEDVPYRLRVVGASRQMFRRTIARLPIATDFRRFTIASLSWDMKGADLCILPGGGDRLSMAGNDARADLARRLGVPVFSAPSGTADWERRLRAQVSGGSAGIKLRERTTPSAQDAASVVQTWKAALTKLPQDRSIAAAGAPEARRLQVLFLLQQFQDLDLICPLAEAANASPDLDVRVAVLTKIAVPAARRLGKIRQDGARVLFWRGRDLLAGHVDLAPGSVDAAVTASDGGGPGSRCAVAFVRAANAIGAATLNLQHGLDNGGLTYGEPNPSRKEPFASRFVLTWGGFERLTASANADTRAKVVPVGCPKRRQERAAVTGFPITEGPIIAVFENLHWRRYDDAYRRRFVEDLTATAEAMPDTMFVIKPHMGGRWFTQSQMAPSLPRNLIIADPATPRWRRFTADAFLAHAAAVITTPSTIALDAARYDLPTALVAYGIEADNYAPLPRLETVADWSGFVRQVRSGEFDMTPVRSFRAAAMLPGDAVARSLAAIRLAAAGCTQAEIVAKLGTTLRPA